MNDIFVEAEAEAEAGVAAEGQAVSIVLNGEAYTLGAEQTTVQALLLRLGLAEKRLAVEVNEAIIPRSQYLDCRLKALDKVEIIVAIGGG